MSTELAHFIRRMTHFSPPCLAMRIRSLLKSAWLWAVIGIIACLGILVLWSHFQLVHMNSPSMEPEIQQGDDVLVFDLIRHPLPKDSLVVVTLSFDDESVTTIRRIAGIPGDLYPSAKQASNTARIPKGHYYVTGISTNALDSRTLGPVSFSEIEGKVIWIPNEPSTSNSAGETGTTN